MSLHTLYHVPAEEQATFLREIARVLRAGRRAVVVSAWQSSPWDLVLRVPGALARRSVAALRKLGRLFATGLAVPSNAVLQEGARQIVYVRVAAGEFVKRSVTAGAAVNGMTPVTAGLSPGDLVVVAGAPLLQAEQERLESEKGKPS